MAGCYFELLHRDHYCISGIFLENRLSRGKAVFSKIKRQKFNLLLSAPANLSTEAYVKKGGKLFKGEG